MTNRLINQTLNPTNMSAADYDAMIEAENARQRPEKVNGYDCPFCNRNTLITIERDAGIAPASMTCPVCKGTAISRWYFVPPFFAHILNGEFYRPDFEAFQQMPDDGEKMHVANGGLLFRKLDAATAPKKSVRQTLHEFNAEHGLCVLPYDLDFKENRTLCSRDASVLMAFDDGRGGYLDRICLEHACRIGLFNFREHLRQAVEARDADAPKNSLASASRKKVAAPSVQPETAQATAAPLVEPPPPFVPQLPPVRLQDIFDAGAVVRRFAPR